MMKTPALLVGVSLCVALLAGCRQPAADAVATTPQASAVTDASYLASVEQWRSERAKKLREPDGWFSFAGSGRIATGSHSVGSAEDNAIVLSKGPARWGVLQLSEDGKLRFDAAPDSGVQIDGKRFGSAVLRTQWEDGGPTSVHAGRTRFYVVRTGDVFGWRFRDPESKALKEFTGIAHFPVDASWRVEAEWRPYPAPRKIDLVTSIGTIEPAEAPGVAVFVHEGKRYALQPIVEEGEDELFFIIADRTSGKETYGGARFLYAPLPRDGKVLLDFNKAQNPPCALTEHVVCPTAPPENRLDLRITAGEKTYAGTH